MTLIGCVVTFRTLLGGMVIVWFLAGCAFALRKYYCIIVLQARYNGEIMGVVLERDVKEEGSKEEGGRRKGGVWTLFFPQK